MIYYGCRRVMSQAEIQTKLDNRSTGRYLTAYYTREYTAHEFLGEATKRNFPRNIIFPLWMISPMSPLSL